VSKLSNLKDRIQTLDEIRSILSAMKNLSVIEVNKVLRFRVPQNEMTRLIEEALADLEQFYEIEPFSAKGSGEWLYLLVGSERGFCGAFNEAVLRRFEKESAGKETSAKILVVGRKLVSKLEGDARLLDSIEGPSVVEEISAVITELASHLMKFPEPTWAIIANDGDNPEDGVAVVYPFARKERPDGVKFRHPPLLNLSPEVVYREILEHYLFSLLYRVFYLSFLEENLERLRHMEGALGTLEKNLYHLRVESNALRQEEITEELELIMLNIDGKAGAGI
jgi:F-type H+-transporting ATPase subunit gamma